MSQDCDYLLLKVLLVGNRGVGSASLIVRYADDLFTDFSWGTIALHGGLKIKNTEMEGKNIKLQIWHPSTGSERFRTINSVYYKGTHGIIVIYDITNRDSFSSVQGYMAEIEKHASELVLRILVGNKCDLESERQVTFEEGQELADH